jgi:polar amino acid transport system substrate-binding protein
MRVLNTLAIAIGLAVAASGSAPDAAAQQAAGASAPLIDQIKRRGKLQVGMASFVPWAMRDRQGNWIGFEVDVARKLAQDLEVELELVPTAWDGIIPALLSSRFDVIIGGMGITPARALQVNFTVPYSRSGTGIAVNRQMTQNMRWPDDYNRADVTFACRRGTVVCRDLERVFPRATVRQFEDTAIAIQEVVNGNAHAVGNSEPAPTFAVLQNPERLAKATDGYFTTSVEGFAIRRGDADTLAFLNGWITLHRENGWLQARHDYWFRTREWAPQVAQ